MNIKIKTNKRDRYIGTYYPDINKFYKEVFKSKHLFRAINAWGIDSKLFTEVLEPKNSLIHIYDKEKRVDYKIDAQSFKKYSLFFHFKNGEDNEHQIFCPIHRFEQIERINY